MARRLSPWTHAILRIAAGLLFMEHGAQKWFGWFGGMGRPRGAAPLMSQLGAAGVLEVAGGALRVIGLFTRPVAAVLLLEMIVAYAQVHLPQGRWPIQNQGELALLYASIFCFLSASGAGPLSVDAMIPAHLRRTGTERRNTHDRRIPV